MKGSNEAGEKSFMKSGLEYVGGPRPGGHSIVESVLTSVELPHNFLIINSGVSLLRVRGGLGG